VAAGSSHRGSADFIHLEDLRFSRLHTESVLRFFSALPLESLRKLAGWVSLTQKWVKGFHHFVPRSFLAFSGAFAGDRFSGNCHATSSRMVSVLPGVHRRP
jgi:hypothetical protein